MPSELSELNSQVRKTLVDALQVEPEMVTPFLAFGDIPQWDSMGHMEVMMLLELQFGVEINPDTIANLISIPAICDYLNDHG